MKVSSSIRSLYSDLYDIAQELDHYVSSNVQEFCNKYSYQYEHRIKSEESFAEKLEMGSNEMYDFLGITIVVPEYSHISKVKKFLSSSFKFVCQHPEKPKKPQDFDFDTPRYYYKCKKMLSLRKKIFCDFIFEIQIVTLLEFCWSKLFHDYSYKSSDISWGKERISFQIKALLKNADMIIHEADKLSSSKILKDCQDNYIQINKIKSFLLKYWDASCLAKNLKRECESINTILKVSQMDLDALESIIRTQTSVNRGASLVNLSPYGAIIQSLLDVKHQKFIDYIQKKIDHTRSGKTILIVDEVEIPENIILNQNTLGQKIQYYKNCAKYSLKKTN